MRVMGVLVLMAGLVVLISAVSAQEQTDDFKKLQGTWALVSP